MLKANLISFVIEKMSANGFRKNEALVCCCFYQIRITLPKYEFMLNFSKIQANVNVEMVKLMSSLYILNPM